MAGVRIGGGEADITPPLGTPFGGFALERATPATAVHDSLLTTATVVAGADGAFALISCDLQTVSPELVTRARAGISARWPIPPEHILIAATHVHSAPGGDASERQIPGIDPTFTTPEAERRIEAGIIAAVGEAYDRLCPALLQGSSGYIPGIGLRRQAPQEAFNSRATILIAVDPAHGRPLAALANYGCHPSVLGPDNTAISADYPGVLRRELGRCLGGIPVNFINAPAGDVSTRATRRAMTFAEVDRLGRHLAGQFRKLLDSLTSLPATPIIGRLAVARLPIDLTLLPHLKHRLASVSDPGDPLGRRLRFQIERLSRLTATTVPCEVQVLRCGDIAFVGIAGELFSAPAAALAATGPAPHMLLIAPANGTVGNIPPPALHASVRPIVAAEAATIIGNTVTYLCDAAFAAAPHKRAAARGLSMDTAPGTACDRTI